MKKLLVALLFALQAAAFPALADVSTTAANGAAGAGNYSVRDGYVSQAMTAGASGVTANYLVTLNSSGQVVNATAGGTGYVGVALSTASSGQAVDVAVLGKATVVADDAIAALGNYVIPGVNTGGRTGDAGVASALSISSAQRIIGKVLTLPSPNSAGSTFTVDLFGLGHFGAALNIAGTCPVVVDLSTPSAPVISLCTTGATPASYTRASITVNAYGQITAVSSGTNPMGWTGFSNGDVPVVTDATGDGTLGNSKLHLTQCATTCTITIADNKTLTINGSATISVTDGSTLTFGAGGTVAYTIASGTVRVNPGSVSANTCQTSGVTVSGTQTGIASTDVIVFTPNADPTSLTGYNGSGTFKIVPWASTNTANFKVCNQDSSSHDPGDVTFNWRVAR